MPRLQIIRQAARGFGDDLETARHGIGRARVGHERFVIEPAVKLNARSMSRSAAVAVSERINRIGYYGGANVRLQPRAADNIDRAVEQTGDVGFQTGVVEQR